MFIVIKIVASGEILGEVVSNHVKKENAINAAKKHAGYIAYETNTRWDVGQHIRKVVFDNQGPITLRCVLG